MGATATARVAAPASEFRHLPQLDGFRGLAILLVLIGHAAGGGPVLKVAPLGVILFFALSGFLITSLLRREQKNHSTIALGSFYIRRALRLAPALLLFLAVVAILTLQRRITDVTPREFAISLLYLRDIFGKSSSLGHLWSLGVEEQYYLVWPWIMKWTPAKYALLYAGIATAAFAVLRTVAIQQNWYPYESAITYERPWFRFDSILIGCCLALALNRPAIVKRLAQATSRIPLAVPWVILLTWTLAAEPYARSFYITVQELLATLTLSQLLVTTGGKPNRFFTNKALSYLGKISYSTYLWQQLFLYVQTPSWGILRTFPINILTPIAIASISFHFVESPILRWKKHFQPDRIKREATNPNGQPQLDKPGHRRH